MKTYVINLAKRPQRLAFMADQLGALGLPFTRVDAIDGTSENTIGYPADHPRLSKAEYACYLSHIKTWKQFLDSGEPRCLILEDDLLLARSLPDILGHAPFFEHSAPVTRLESRAFQAKVSKFWSHTYKGRKLRRLTAYDGGTGALVLTRAYVAYLLKNHATPKIPVDDLVLNPAHTRFSPHIVYQLDPSAATQRLFLDPQHEAYDSQSDLQESRVIPPPEAKSLLRETIAQLGRNIRNNLFHTFKIIPFDED